MTPVRLNALGTLVTNLQRCIVVVTARLLNLSVCGRYATGKNNGSQRSRGAVAGEEATGSCNRSQTFCNWLDHAKSSVRCAPSL